MRSDEILRFSRIIFDPMKTDENRVYLSGTDLNGMAQSIREMNRT